MKNPYKKAYNRLTVLCLVQSLALLYAGFLQYRSTAANLKAPGGAYWDARGRYYLEVYNSKGKLLLLKEKQPTIMGSYSTPRLPGVYINIGWSQDGLDPNVCLQLWGWPSYHCDKQDAEVLRKVVATIKSLQVK